MTTRDTKRRVVCRSCGETGPHEAHGLCARCYGRWRQLGRPDVTGGRFTPRVRRPVAERLPEYAELTVMGCTREEIAARMGVAPRTVDRYARRLRQQGRTPLDLLTEEEAHAQLGLDDLAHCDACGDTYERCECFTDDNPPCTACGRPAWACGCVMHRGRPRPIETIPTGGLI